MKLDEALVSYTIFLAIFIFGQFFYALGNGLGYPQNAGGNGDAEALLGIAICAVGVVFLSVVAIQAKRVPLLLALPLITFGWGYYTEITPFFYAFQPLICTEASLLKHNNANLDCACTIGKSQQDRNAACGQ